MKIKYLFISTLFALFTSCYETDNTDINSSFTTKESLDNFQEEPNNSENYKELPENPFILVNQQAISTFSVDADGGSYANARRYLKSGYNPPKESIRVEEFINYFTFNYNEPTGNENVGLNSDIASCPWNRDHHVMRLGMKGLTIPLEDLPSSNYVFLIDVSGSMNNTNKLGILKTGFKTMVDNLRDSDRIAIVTYAGKAGLLLPSTLASEKNKIKAAIDQLGAGGSTAGAAGINTAYEIAEKYFVQGGNNRIILGSDGDFNVGISNTEELIQLIEEKRESGIYLTVLGVGQGNLNDHMMERIANNGNGNYEYIDSAEEIEKIFNYDLTKFYTVAKDSKIQIKFNPNKVASYRLIGYENRALNNDDFENDKKDAGEIGSGQTITALYELVLTSNNTDEKFADFDFRYKKPNEENSILIQHKVQSEIKEIENADDNIKFASAITAFGLILKQSEHKGNANKTMVLNLANSSKSYDPNGLKQEFINLVTNWNP